MLHDVKMAKRFWIKTVLWVSCFYGSKSINPTFTIEHGYIFNKSIRVHSVTLDDHRATDSTSILYRHILHILISVALSYLALLPCLLNTSQWVTYLQNRLSTICVVKTPFEHFKGKKPDVSHLRVFGAKIQSCVT